MTRPWLHRGHTRRHLARVVVVALPGLALLLALAGPVLAQGNRLVVGSKNFLENKLLAEMFAQLIEARTDLDVERRLGLAGPQVCF